MLLSTAIVAPMRVMRMQKAVIVLARLGKNQLAQKSCSYLRDRVMVGASGEDEGRHLSASDKGRIKKR